MARLLTRLRSDEAGATRRMLVVDSNESSALRLQRLIEERDYSVDVAATLVQTISLAIEHTYDVIIVDTTQRQPAELGLVSQLRGLQRDAAFLLAVDAREHALPGEVPSDFGIAGTLGKPWQEDELRSALARALGLRTARQRQSSEARRSVESRNLLVIGSSLDAYRVQALVNDSDYVTEISVARSVATAVKILKQRTFTAILSELNLPDACGLDAVVQLSGAAPTCPILVYTGLDDDVLAGQVLQAGAQEVLFKQDTDAKQLERAIHHSVQRHRAQQRLSHQALHDSLTNLANRTLLQQRLSSALSRARRKELTFAVLYLDLDRFKWINDNLGHHVGDQVLQTVSERLTHAVREYDTVARLGGDEFAILLDTLDSEDEAVTVAERILHVMAEPIDAGEHRVTVTTSIGIGVYPGSGARVEELINAADRAMYVAKQRGRDGYQLATHHAAPEPAPQSMVRSNPGHGNPGHSGADTATLGGTEARDSA